VPNGLLRDPADYHNEDFSLVCLSTLTAFETKKMSTIPIYDIPSRTPFQGFRASKLAGALTKVSQRVEDSTAAELQKDPIRDSLVN
jgi:hypothetical protein